MPQRPTVTIYFTGLMILCYDQQLGLYQIGIHSKTDDKERPHELRLRFVTKGPHSEILSDQTVTIKNLLLRQISATSDLCLNVEGGPVPTQRIAEPFITGDLSEPPTDPQDIRRVVSLGRLYGRPLEVNRDVLRPIITVKQGLFYTAELTSDAYLAVPIDSNGSHQPQYLGCIAAVIGANFYFTHPKQTLVLRLVQNGLELLRLNRTAGMTYEITVDNGDVHGALPGGDFHYYYEALKLHRGEPKILVEPCGLPVVRGGRVPCMPVELGTSDGFGFDQGNDGAVEEPNR